MRNTENFINKLILKLIETKNELEQYIEISKDTGYTEDAVQNIETTIECLRKHTS